MFTDVQLDLLFVMPTGLVVGYFHTRLLSMREPVQYLAIVFLIAVTVNSFRSGFTPELKIALGFFYDILLPFVFSQGKVSRRVTVIASVEICLFADELVAGALWMVLTDAPMSSYDAAREYFGAFVLMHAVHLVILVGLLTLLRVAFDWWSEDSHMPGQWLLAGFPAAQFALLFCAVNMGYLFFRSSTSYYLACSVMVMVGLVVDALFLRTLNSYYAAQAECERVAELAERLELDNTYCAATIRRTEEVAKFRHDMRNHLQVIAALADQGESEAARGYARKLSSRLARSEVEHA